MPGDGKWLQPGARLDNLLPAFGAATAPSPSPGRKGRAQAKQKAKTKTTKQLQHERVAPRHLPPTGGDWRNPAGRAPQAHSRVADASFSIPLTMPVAVAGGANRPTGNTDELVPAFARRGLDRRLPRKSSGGGGGGGAFSVDESPVFRPGAGGLPIRASQPIAADGGTAGSADDDVAGAGGADASSTAAAELKPVRMHPFFSGIHDPLVDYSLKVDVPARAEFRCVAPDTNFDLFELDRTSNTSTWHSIEPNSGSATGGQSGDGEVGGVHEDYVTFSLGEGAVRMTKAWVRDASHSCGGVEGQRSSAPSAEALAAHGLRATVAAVPLPALSGASRGSEQDASQSRQQKQAQAASPGSRGAGPTTASAAASDAAAAAAAAAVGTSASASAAALSCRTQLGAKSQGHTFAVRFNVQGQQEALDAAGPVLLFVGGRPAGQLTAGAPQVDVPGVVSGTALRVVDQRRGMELNVCVGDVAAASQDAYQLTWIPLKLQKEAPPPPQLSATAKKHLLAQHADVVAGLQQRVDIVDAQLHVKQRESNFIEALALQDDLNKLRAELSEAREKDVFYVPPPPKRFGTSSLSVMSQRNIDWRTHTLQNDPVRPRASGGGLTVQAGGELVPKLRVIVQPL